MIFSQRYSAAQKLLATAALAAAAILASPVSSAAATTVPAAAMARITATTKTKLVPDVVGKTASVARNTLKKSGLSYRYSPPKGSVVILSKNWTVTKQSPKAHSKVKAGTKITLTVVKTAALTPHSSAGATAAAPSGPVLSVAQQQAVVAATGYLSDGQGFSYQGLIDQLSSPYGNSFSVADATAAVNALNPDWNAQAVIAAKGYLSSGMGFSHASLVDQLTSAYGNKFTPEQAEYAVSQVGL